MAPRELRPADKKALEDAIGTMVKTAAWQRILKERGWVDAYMPSDQFASFVDKEQVRIESMLKEVGLIK